MLILNGTVAGMAHSARLPESGEARARIVVIDDDEAIRELVKLHLRNAGYEVLAAEDAVEGGHLIVNSRPHLVICDVDMPYMDGYDFAAAMRGDPATSDIPLVFLTVDDDVAEHARKVGAAAYLKKPFRADRLVEVVGFLASR